MTVAVDETVFINHVLIYGIHYHVVSSSTIAEIAEGENFTKQSGARIVDAEDYSNAEVSFTRLVFMLLAKGEGGARLTSSVPELAFAGNKREDEENLTRTKPQPLESRRFIMDLSAKAWEDIRRESLPYVDAGSIAVATLFFFSISSGIIVTLVQRTLSLLAAAREGHSVPATAWMEPLSFLLLLIVHANVACFGGAVVWNLGFITATLRRTFQLFSEAIKDSDFKSIEDAKKLGRTFPRLLHISRKMSNVGLDHYVAPVVA